MRLLFAALLVAVPWLAVAQSSSDCLTCHSDPSLVKKHGKETVSLFADSAALGSSSHAGLSCVDCHGKLNPENTPHAKVIPLVKCQGCHDVGGFDKSVHGRLIAGTKGKSQIASDAGCKECHGTHAILSPKDPKSSANRAALSKTCGKCHAEVAAHYSESAHGVALAAGIKGAPACPDCHGEHKVEHVASKDSPVYKTGEAKVCLSCHLDNPDVRQKVGPSAGFIKSYETSVHGLALAKGNLKAATCSDCHGAHDMRNGNDPGSRVSKANLSETCAKCHADIAATFNASIHGTALKNGNRDAPSCTDCHGEHQILGPKDPHSRVAAQNVSAQVCAGCHNSVQLSNKYDMPPERFKTFSDSYHGLASKAGAVQVANCASCHGVHNIRPSSDPASTISPANLAATCGHCHPGANRNFTKGSVHIVVERRTNAVLYWIRLIYLSLIFMTIGGMLAHNFLDFLKKFKRQRAIRSGGIPAPHYTSTEYLRMSLAERLQHAALFTSFITLVITGFMLKFPDAWWVVPIRQMSEKVFAVRGLLHRTAAVIMVLASLFHLGYLAFTTRGRKLAVDMLPRVKDVRDAIGLTLYNLGLTKTKPLFDRFGYIEKAEYWALIWGTAVMTFTGVIMWFDNYFIGIFTKLGWDIARTIHYYEAWLATLAIVVWHFYFVIFNPDAYPMNTAWFTGKVTEEMMEEEHPLELTRIRPDSFSHLEK